MLLKRCYVQGFGKLQNFTYEFTEGLNVICAENGWGKSTFAAFLRAMFYGLPQASSRTKLEEAERRKYRPWNGAVMGGFLEFEVNGKTYKAERTFGKKEAEDTFRLTDLSTNLESADFSDRLGEELFGLDKEAYSRSTYLPQNKISDGGMNDSIGKKLGKMAEGEEESGNYDRAFLCLEELRKKYIPDRQKDEKGYVAELTKQATLLQSRIEACRRKEESAKPWKEKEQEAAEQRKQAEEELLVCRKQLEAAGAYEALAAKKQHYTELCGREESLRVKKKSIEELFADRVPALSEIIDCRRDAEDAVALSGELRSYRLESGELSELSELQQKFFDGIPNREEIQNCIRNEGEINLLLSQAEQDFRQEEEKGNQAKKAKRICMLFAAVLFLLATVTFIGAFAGKNKAKTEQTTEVRETAQQKTSSTVNTGLLVLGSVFALGFFVSGGLGICKAKGERLAESKIHDYSTEIEKLKEQGEQGRTLLLRYKGTETEDVTADLYRLAEKVQRYETLLSRKEKLEQCTARRDALLAGSIGLLTEYGMDTGDITGNLRILENRTRDFLRIAEDFEEAVNLREQFEKETSPESLLGLELPEVSFALAQERERELLGKIARAAEEEKDCRDRAEAFLAEAEACTELEEQQEEVTGRLEAKKREHFYITETLKCLKNAKEQFSSRYMRGLTEGFQKYISLLGEEDFVKNTEGNFNGIHADIDLNIRVTAYGEEKELGYFSTGMKDLVGLCMRFALVDALFTEESPVLVLDDPFVNLDEEKMKRATALLRETAKQYQVLYLVCHESRV
ncbi:MAG: AAA family ATPase [Lachnospiraceae bacterium]|nr:AAA family ATPase [Lachnospiraceae bacterium]